MLNRILSTAFFPDRLVDSSVRRIFGKFFVSFKIDSLGMLSQNVIFSFITVVGFPVGESSTMCLLGLIFRDHHDFSIAMFDNREEQRERPTDLPRWHEPISGSCYWFGGKDLQAEGTWLGINERGIVVAITNRPKAAPIPKKRSRGLLCRDLLEFDSVDAGLNYARTEFATNKYEGCNLLVVSPTEGFVYEAGDESNVMELGPGTHILSNGSLNDPEDFRVCNIRSSLNTLRKNNDLSIPEIKAICSGHDADEKNSACRDGENWGTVSSTILRVPTGSSDVDYLYSPGPPCQTVYHNYSQEIQKRIFRSQETRSIEMRETSYPYRIHLKGPWQFHWLGSIPEFEKSPDDGTARMPASWESIFGNSFGVARFSRSFHSPTNLDRDEHVFLVFEGVGGFRDLSFNGNEITKETTEPSPAHREVNITDLLLSFNKIEIVIEWKGLEQDREEGGLWGPVLLEIRKTDSQ